MKNNILNSTMNQVNGKHTFHHHTHIQPMNGKGNTGFFKKLNHYFLHVAKADLEILKQCPDTERGKYTLLGILLVLMTLFNIFSIAHFFDICGLDSFYYVPLSLLISLIILKIDQLFIASSISNPDDGIFKKLRNNAIRIIFSLVISFVIPIPVKLMIFDDAIQKAYHNDKLLLIDSIRNKKFTTPENEQYYADLKLKSQELDRLIANKTYRIDSLNKALEHPTCRYFYYDEHGNKKYAYTVKGKNIIQEIDQSKLERNMLLVEKEKVKFKVDSLNQLLHNQTQANRHLTDSLLNAHALNFALKYKYYNKVTDYYIDSKFPFIHGDYFCLTIILSLLFGFLDFMPVFLKTFMFNGTYELIQYTNYQTTKHSLDNNLKKLAETKKAETDALLADIEHKKLLDKMKKNHEIELIKIKYDYEKALELMQTKDNLQDALFIVNDVASKLRDLFNDEVATVKSPHFFNDTE